MLIMQYPSLQRRKVEGQAHYHQVSYHAATSIRRFLGYQKKCIPPSESLQCWISNSLVTTFFLPSNKSYSSVLFLPSKLMVQYLKISIQWAPYVMPLSALAFSQTILCSNLNIAQNAESFLFYCSQR